jgi:hypothetical protein
MAGPADNLNQPAAQSGPTPVQNPGEKGNSLGGTEYAQLGRDIQELRRQMDAGSISAKELAQEQANLIDNHQALVAQRVKEMSAADRLKRQISELTLKTDPAIRAGEEFQTKITELTKNLKVAQERADDLGKAAKAVGKALNDVVKNTEHKTKADEQQSEMAKDLTAKALSAGQAIGKAGGPMADFGKLALGLAAKLPMLGTAIGAVSKLLGGAVMGGLMVTWSAAAMIFRSATRESTTFANTYGTSLGFAVAQQNAFKRAIDGVARASYDVTKIQDIGSAVMKAGAYDAYAANRMIGFNYANQGEASVALAAKLGEASTTMMRFGTVMGMTEAQSADLLSTFVSTIGAFDASLPNANAKLGETVNRFGQMAKATGASLPSLIKFIGGVSEETLGTGVSFNTLAAQTTGAMKAISEYGTRVGSVNNMLLSTSGGMEKVVRTLYAMGSAMSASTTYGYQLSAGLASAKNPMKGIIEAASMSPLQRIMAQQKAFAAAGKDVDTQIVMMMQNGLKDKFVPTMRGILGDPKALGALNLAAKAKDEAGINAALKGVRPDMMDEVRSMATQMQAARDPMEMLVDLTKTGNAYLATMTTQLAKAGGGTPTATPEARSFLAKHIPLRGR